jgi:hypothetical protein
MLRYPPAREFELMKLHAHFASQADRERRRDLLEIFSVYLEAAIKFTA